MQSTEKHHTLYIFNYIKIDKTKNQKYVVSMPGSMEHRSLLIQADIAADFLSGSNRESRYIFRILHQVFGQQVIDVFSVDFMNNINAFFAIRFDRLNPIHFDTD